MPCERGTSAESSFFPRLAAPAAIHFPTTLAADTANNEPDIAAMFRALIAVSVCAIAELVRKCKKMHEELVKSREELERVRLEAMESATAAVALQAQTREQDEGFRSQLSQLKDEFEEEWLAREREWQTKMSAKEEDAQQRLVEISSWQQELSRLRTEAIAIRSAIEKVRSRSTSPGRSEQESFVSESVVSDLSLNKENGAAEAKTADAVEATSASPVREPLQVMR